MSPQKRSNESPYGFTLRWPLLFQSNCSWQNLVVQHESDLAMMMSEYGVFMQHRNNWQDCHHWIHFNRICGVLVSVLASGAVDRGFGLRSSRTKDYAIGICCFSAKHTAFRSKNKDWLVRNQDNVSEWLFGDCCVCDRRLWSSTNRTSSSFHWRHVTCSRHDITEGQKRSFGF
jgi:hypothetical protein